jgi:protein-S-isoprenylcysteine O-methyltransferase Ste14
MATLWLTLRSILYATLFLGFWFWLAQSLRPLDRWAGAPLPDWTPAPGVVLMAAGAALMLWCIGVFIARGRGTPALFDAPRRLVFGGPYRIVRNPMYVGGLALLAGYGAFQRSPAVLGLCVAAAFCLNLLIRLHEEPRLRRLFDGDYEAYCHDVPRWLPRHLSRHLP